MHKKLLFAALLALGLALVSTPSQADTISAGGVTYTFTNAGSDGTNVYDIDMTVNTSGADTAGTLSSFNVQFAGSTSATLDSSSSSSNIGTWSFVGDNPNTPSGCNTMANATPDHCFDTSSPITFANNGTGGTYTFEFDVTYPDGVSPTSADIQAFQSQGDLAISNGTDIGTPGTPGGPPSVPEPSSISMLGFGLLGLMGMMLVRRKAIV